jgi:hypothetical protein
MSMLQHDGDVMPLTAEDCHFVNVGDLISLNNPHRILFVVKIEEVKPNPQDDKVFFICDSLYRPQQHIYIRRRSLLNFLISGSAEFIQSLK